MVSFGTHFLIQFQFSTVTNAVIAMPVWVLTSSTIAKSDVALVFSDVMETSYVFNMILKSGNTVVIDQI